MPHTWILDVLHDLRAYAGLNGLTGLTDDIDTLLNSATRELTPGHEASGGASGGADAGAVARHPTIAHASHSL